MDNLTHTIPVGRPIEHCQWCGHEVVTVDGVVLEYPEDGRIIGKAFEAHDCQIDGPDD